VTKKFLANDFTTVLPEGWRDRSVLTMIGPITDDGFAVNVVILREEVGPHVSVEDYAQRQRDETAAQVPGLETLDQRATTVNGRPAYQILQRMTANGRLVQQVQTYVLSAGVIFVITGSAPEALFAQHIGAFREVVEYWEARTEAE
jgi:hypothetical protein